jgi:exodeoxyribonuclease VII small subunit
MSESLTYEAAFQELKQIESEIAGESISVDLLSERIQRASFLLQFCQAKLRATEEEVGKIIAKIEKGGA